jgi:hypothetical protein
VARLSGLTLYIFFFAKFINPGFKVRWWTKDWWRWGTKLLRSVFKVLNETKELRKQQKNLSNLMQPWRKNPQSLRKNN